MTLLNPWQRGFPLVREPFEQIARIQQMTPQAVLDGYRALQRDGSLSRIGGVFGAGSGGAAVLAAMAVPADRLQAVAAQVSAHPGVNHNYEREHRLNLWFVVNAGNAAAVEAAVTAIEQATGLPALRLPMLQAYRIDLGFDLHDRTARHRMPATGNCAPVAPRDLELAALLESGLPLVARPFDQWADALGRTPDVVLATLSRWLAQGTLKRFGAIVRHHELGFAANAMTVFDVPDEQVDACGQALSRESGITLAYRRARAPGWPYNLYCMVHGRDRAAVLDVLRRAVPASGLAGRPQALLFSRTRFKQTGARRFRDLVPSPAQALHAER